MLYRLWEELEKPGAFAGREYCLADLDDPAGQHNLREDAFPDFEPAFSPVFLSDDSSLVDFVHDGAAIGGRGLLVSERVLEILGTMKLPPHQPYRLEVVHREKPVPGRYFWVQILRLDNYGWIDFARSRFTRKRGMDMSDSRGEPVEIRSEQELKELIEASWPEDFRLHFENLTLNRLYARAPFDLFYLENIGGLSSQNPLISAKLKAALERAGVVGYRLTEPPISVEA